MQRFSSSWALCTVFAVLFALNVGVRTPARDAANAHQLVSNQPLGGLAPFRSIAAGTLAFVNAGNLTGAKTRIKSLETSWDKAEAKLRPRNPEQWQVIDKAIDAALSQLRADKPQASAAKDALENLLAVFDRPSQSTTALPAPVEAARLSVTDIIGAVEKLQAGASVLDVSFEPKDGRPAYAVRTYGNGKVRDGTFDATSGAAIDQGTTMDESALDAEDKAELAALQGAKITLRQAIALAENARGGRALNAGLEQVRGRAVWEILIQDSTQPQPIHIDPVTGKFL
jgi:uncharacterized membrane protein YkoI